MTTKIVIKSVDGSKYELHNSGVDNPAQVLFPANVGDIVREALFAMSVSGFSAARNPGKLQPRVATIPTVIQPADPLQYAEELSSLVGVIESVVRHGGVLTWSEENGQGTIEYDILDIKLSDGYSATGMSMGYLRPVVNITMLPYGKAQSVSFHEGFEDPDYTTLADVDGWEEQASGNYNNVSIVNGVVTAGSASSAWVDARRTGHDSEHATGHVRLGVMMPYATGWTLPSAGTGIYKAGVVLKDDGAGNRLEAYLSNRNASNVATTAVYFHVDLITGGATTKKSATLVTSATGDITIEASLNEMTFRAIASGPGLATITVNEVLNFPAPNGRWWTQGLNNGRTGFQMQNDSGAQAVSKISYIESAYAKTTALTNRNVHQISVTNMQADVPSPMKIRGEIGNSAPWVLASCWPKPERPVSILQDGFFSSGSLTNTFWQAGLVTGIHVAGTSVAIGQPYSGSYGMRVVLPNTVDTGVSKRVWYPFKAGRMYIVSFLARRTTGSANLRAVIGNATGPDISSSTDATVGTTWTRVEGVWIPASDTMNAYVCVKIGGSGGSIGGTYDIDEVTVHEVTPGLNSKPYHGLGIMSDWFADNRVIGDGGYGPGVIPFVGSSFPLVGAATYADDAATIAGRTVDFEPFDQTSSLAGDTNYFSYNIRNDLFPEDPDGGGSCTISLFARVKLHGSLAVNVAAKYLLPGGSGSPQFTQYGVTGKSLKVPTTATNRWGWHYLGDLVIPTASAQRPTRGSIVIGVYKANQNAGRECEFDVMVAVPTKRSWFSPMGFTNTSTAITDPTIPLLQDFASAAMSGMDKRLNPDGSASRRSRDEGSALDSWVDDVGLLGPGPLLEPGANEVLIMQLGVGVDDPYRDYDETVPNGEWVIEPEPRLVYPR